MADNISATPRNELLGLLSDAYQWMQSPERTQQMQGFAGLLGTTGLPQTVERMAYGEPLTNIGRANVPLLKPETADALMTVAPMTKPAAVMAGRTGRAVGRMAGEEINAAMMGERGGLLGAVTPQVKALDVWHGSPHGPFRSFNPEKVGTGEGTQVFGEGAYLAEARGTGEEYRKRLSDFGSPYTYEYQGKTYTPQESRVFDPVRHAIQLTYHQGKKVAQSIAKTGLADAKKGEAYALEMGGIPYYEQMLNTAKEINKKDIKATQGFLYKVDLPDEQIANMVQWETPLSEMDDKLVSVIKPLQEQLMSQPNPALFKNAKSVGDVIQYANALKLEPHIPLQKAGYSGIKYLDQMSRGAGKGTSNFVVFPQYQDLLTIKEINDQPIGGLLDISK